MPDTPRATTDMPRSAATARELTISSVINLMTKRITLQMRLTRTATIIPLSFFMFFPLHRFRNLDKRKFAACGFFLPGGLPRARRTRPQRENNACENKRRRDTERHNVAARRIIEQAGQERTRCTRQRHHGCRPADDPGEVPASEVRAHRMGQKNNHPAEPDAGQNGVEV